MNARAVEPPAIHEFIFGDQQLHARFSLAIELLARIMTARQRSVTTAALAEAVGQSSRTVRAVLAGLRQSGLLSQDDSQKDAWVCSSSPGTITLADIFRCVASTTPEPSRKKKCSSHAAEESRTTSQQSVDLLLMQATMGINQVVLQHLQAFDLGRLKAVGSASKPHRFDSSVRSYITEPL